MGLGPDDPVGLLIMKQGYERKGQTLTADGREHVVTIRPVFRLTGTVPTPSRDEHRQVPRDSDSLLRAHQSLSGAPRGKNQTMGRFGMQFEGTDVEHGIQIEAPGYQSFRTDKHYRLGDADAVLDVRMQPAKRFLGTVLNPDGRPVQAARVSLASSFEQLIGDGLTTGDEHYGDSNNRVNTDQAGAFETRLNSTATRSSLSPRRDSPRSTARRTSHLARSGWHAGRS